MPFAALPTLSESAAAIEKLDLSRIEKRVAEEQNWDAEKVLRNLCFHKSRFFQASDVVREYRKFLHLLRRHGSSARIVPSKDVDEVRRVNAMSGIHTFWQIWHAHILFTRKYQADCERIFGYYMHHAPSDEGEESRTKDQQDYQEVLNMYREGSTSFCKLIILYVALYDSVW